MSDNTAVTAGTGTIIATDETAGSVHYQRVKLTDGTADSTAVIPGDATNGLYVNDTKRGAFSVVATLTVTNGAYSIADAVGGLITWAAVARANGGSVTIDTIVLNGVTAIPYELWFYNADIATPRADNAVFGTAAADGLKHLGTVPITAADYAAAQTAFVAGTVRGVGITCSVGAATTSLFGYLKATATTSPGTTTIYLRISGVRND